VRQQKILVVDDSRPQVMLISTVMKRAGYDVHVAYDGEEGLAMAAQIIPDLIILDIMMPKMNGYEVCLRLKRSPATSRVAVLMLTAKGGIDEDVRKPYEHAQRVKDRMLGFDVGAVDFLTKPVKVKDLTKRVNALLTLGF